MPINVTSPDISAIVSTLGLAVEQIGRGETSSHDERVIQQAIISLRVVFGSRCESRA
jgi:hypothetical protein